MTIKSAMEAKLDVLNLGGGMARFSPPRHGRIEFSYLMEVWGSGGRKNGFCSGLAYEVSSGMNPQEAVAIG